MVERPVLQDQHDDVIDLYHSSSPSGAPEAQRLG
jgi:hypothetical protein